MYEKINMNVILQRIILLIYLLFSSASFALDPVQTGYFSSEAIKGYDSVAYFTENKAVKGNSDFSFEYNGATWLFASQENLGLFKGSPEAYSPQYGGYCAYAVSQGTTASIKPELFTIHKGKLYLNYNQKINKQWSESKDSFIIDADKNWPKLLND